MFSNVGDCYILKVNDRLQKNKFGRMRGMMALLILDIPSQGFDNWSPSCSNNIYIFHCEKDKSELAKATNTAPLCTHTCLDCRDW